MHNYIILRFQTLIYIGFTCIFINYSANLRHLITTVYRLLLLKYLIITCGLFHIYRAGNISPQHTFFNDIYSFWYSLTQTIHDYLAGLCYGIVIDRLIIIIILLENIFSIPGTRYKKRKISTKKKLIYLLNFFSLNHYLPPRINI